MSRSILSDLLFSSGARVRGLLAPIEKDEPLRLADLSYPVGTFASSALDNGSWLRADGSVVSQTDYPELFNIIGHRPQFKPITTSFGNTAAGTLALYCIAYGNGVYVGGVSGSGYIVHSTDLSTWTAVQADSSAGAIMNIVFADGMFIAVSAGGYILKSVDGITWTTVASNTSTSWIGLSYANGRFVACGGTGYVGYSTDGTSWTVAQISSSVTYAYNVVYIEDTGMWFVFNGNSTCAYFLYSADGSTWSVGASPTGAAVKYLGWDGVGVYVTGYTARYFNQIYRTTNGTTWETLGNMGVRSEGGYVYGATTGSKTLLCNRSYIKSGASSAGLQNLPKECSPITSGITYGNPQGRSQPVIFSSVVYTLLYSLDEGFTWDFAGFGLGATGTPFGVYRSHYHNGKYFFADSYGIIYYTSLPYDLSTQFQLPTKLDGAGSANLYIKAKY